MPAVLKIDPKQGIVLSTFYGEVTDEEVVRHSAVITADPDFDPKFSEIVDLAGATRIAISEAMLTGMAGAHSIFSPSSVHVVVAPADLAFGLARRYQALASKTRPNFVVVRSLPEAYKALGITPIP
jgi:hypothetical protein